MKKTTVEHQAGGCRLCSISLEDESTQVAFLLCPDCQRLARAATGLLKVLSQIYDESRDPNIERIARAAIKEAEEKP